MLHTLHLYFFPLELFPLALFPPVADWPILFVTEGADEDEELESLDDDDDDDDLVLFDTEVIPFWVGTETAVLGELLGEGEARELVLFEVDLVELFSKQ